MRQHCHRFVVTQLQLPECTHGTALALRTQDKYNLKLPPFPGTSQCIKISGAAVDPSQVMLVNANDQQDKQRNLLHARQLLGPQIRENYEKNPPLMEADVGSDPLQLFDTWFKDAVGRTVEPTAMCAQHSRMQAAAVW